MNHSRPIRIILGGMACTSSFAFPALWFAPHVTLIYFYHCMKNHRFKELVFSYSVFAIFSTFWLVSTVHRIGSVPWSISILLYMCLIGALGFLKWYECILTNIMSHRRIFFPIVWASIWTLGAALKETIAFPLILIGTTQVAGPFSFLFPFLGVYGVTFVMIFFAGLIVEKSWKLMTVLILLFASISLLSPQPESLNDSINVTVIQGPSQFKNPSNERYYHHETDRINNSDLIVWPESTLDHHAAGLRKETINYYQKKMNESHSGLIAGTTFRENNQFFNTTSGFGRAGGYSYKRHLVPFSETVPFTATPIIGPLITAILHSVTNLQPAFSHPDDPSFTSIQYDHYSLAPFVCYDAFFYLDRYPSDSHLNVVLSNNSWFESKLAHQLMFEKAQIISLLTKKPTIVASVSGISGLIDAHGKVVQQSTTDKIETLNFQTSLYKGSTFWSDGWSNHIVFALCIIVVLMSYILKKKGNLHGVTVSSKRN